MSTAARVLAIVLHHVRLADTLECLASLTRSTYPHLEVLVLDTRAIAGSAASIRATFPAVEVLELERNLGYAGNNNIGLARALERGFEFALMINDDAVVAPDCIEHLVRASLQDRVIGMTGPTVYHREQPSVVQSAGGELTPAWITRWKTDCHAAPATEPRDVAWVPGCVLMVRRELCEDIGLLDDRFFTYWEEVEWCVRAVRRGWRVVHVPAARAWHRDPRPVAAAATYYMTRNRLLALAMHRAPLRLWLLVTANLAATLVSWSVRPKWRHLRPHRTAIWHGLLDFARGRVGERR